MRALVLLLAALPALAAPIYTAPLNDGSSIVLTDDAGPCVGQARLALWVSRDARTQVPGCYAPPAPGAEAVFVLFLDGELAKVPLAALRKPVVL